MPTDKVLNELEEVSRKVLARRRGEIEQDRIGGELWVVVLLREAALIVWRRQAWRRRGEMV